MRSRSFLAATLACMAIVLGLLVPLTALVALRASAPLSAKQSGTAPAPLGLVRPAGPPLVTRIDGRGRARRLYFPATAGVGDPEMRARALLSQEAVRLGIAAAPPDLDLVAVRTSPSGTHVRLQQTVNGVPVWGAEAVVSFDARLAPTVVASDLETVPAGVSTVARVAPAAACSTAVRAIGCGDRPASVEALVHLRERASVWRLEYRVRFVSVDPPGDWEVWIDASTGVVVDERDRTVFAASGLEGSGWVFLPDPCTATGDPSLSDDSDSDAAVPAGAYITVGLHDLDAPSGGWYRLSGPWVRIVDWELPMVAPDSSATLAFLRTRSEAGFEDVMAYYHIDAMQRWYRALGFTNANAVRQIVDPHGLNGQDNSKFVPSLHQIAYGEGGVDDAEDAEVIVHEYAHATQYDIVPTWGTGGHTGAMGEGFGDYLANAYAWSLYPERVEAWNGVFEWDGHNEYWAGRKAIDASLLYPGDAGGSLYRAGTLWCSALTDALYALRDRAVMDRLVLDHHYALTGSATMEDAANAILAADVALYAGVHVALLADVFDRWGMVDASNWQPVHIDHAPPEIAAFADGAVDLEARIVSSMSPIDPSSVTARVRTVGGGWTNVPLTPRGDDRYGTMLDVALGENVDLEYTIEARDALGNFACVPVTSPRDPWRLRIGRFADSFESPGDWQVGAPGDAATSGVWVRGTPVGTAAQASADHTGGGSTCYVTGNAAPGAAVGEADVDGGATTLLSPVWDLRDATGARLSYWRWFSNDQGTAPDEDVWSVDASNDGGLTWSALESTTVSEARWKRLEFDLGAALGELDRVRVRFVARDTGGASIVEAAVDDVLLQVRTATDAPESADVDHPVLLAPLPNPARPATTFRFHLAAPSQVRLTIYDARGRRIRELRHASLVAGEHTVAWDGRDARGDEVARGVYIATLETAGTRVSRKLTLIR